MSSCSPDDRLGLVTFLSNEAHNRAQNVVRPGIRMRRDPGDKSRVTMIEKSSSEFFVVVKHLGPGVKRYTWEVRTTRSTIPIMESTDRFHSWEEASRAGKRILSSHDFKRISRSHSKLRDRRAAL